MSNPSTTESAGEAPETNVQEQELLAPLGHHMGPGVHALVDLGKQLTQVIQLDGYDPELVQPGKDPRRLTKSPLARPRFLSASPVFHDVAAFIAYVNDFRDGATRIFYATKGTFLAVIDYHQPNTTLAPWKGEARHGVHLALLELVVSPEWAMWKKHNEEAQGQVEFAEFLEDNALDVIDPSIETMLQVATKLTATKNATFRGAHNLSNGTIGVSWDENVEGQIQGSNTQIPTEFKLALRPWLGCDRFPIQTRLRYRVSGGGVKFFYKMLHLDPILESSLQGLVEKIAGETGIRPALGDAKVEVFAKGL